MMIHRLLRPQPPRRPSLPLPPRIRQVQLQRLRTTPASPQNPGPRRELAEVPGATLREPPPGLPTGA